MLAVTAGSIKLGEAVDERWNYSGCRHTLTLWQTQQALEIDVKGGEFLPIQEQQSALEQAEDERRRNTEHTYALTLNAPAVSSS